MTDTSLAPLAIVFDMDGVLVDTRESYDRAVVLTVERYLRDVFATRSELATTEAARRLRHGGGFNNDWDLSYALLAIAVARSGLSTAEFVTLCSAVERAGGGIAGVADVLALEQVASRSFRGVEYRGDVESGNAVKRLFQQIYLGAELFRSLYGSEPEHWQGAGLIDSESPLIVSDVLQRLCASARLAIATGRPRAEAQHALARFGWGDLFAPVITLDDCPPGKRKPSAYPLLRAFEGLDARFEGVPRGRIYVGDLPDDMAAARAAAVELQQSVLFVNIGTLSGADSQLTSANELPAELERWGLL